MTNPEHLSAGDQVRLTQVLARCPQLAATARHVASFAAMMSQRTGKDQLPAWLDAVTADDLPALHSFVAGLRRDQDAVTHGLSLDYSSGQVEGNVNRIILWNLMSRSVLFALVDRDDRQQGRGGRDTDLARRGAGWRGNVDQPFQKVI